jgi:DNA-binding IclR family transcriptional regulator
MAGALQAKTSVPALDRGLDVLESMSSAREPQTLTQIARRLGRSVSEVQRTVARLTARGYLVRDDQGGYRLSSKLFRIASTFPPFRDLTARAMAPMQKFADETGESVHLGVLSDDRMLLIGQAEGRGFVRVSLQLGAIQDPAGTVSGRLLLCGLSPEAFAAFVSKNRIPKSQRSALSRRLSRIALRGYESSPSSLVEGVQDMGVPVILPGGQVIAALTCSWLPFKRGGKKLGRLLGPLRQAARRISDSYEPSSRRPNGATNGG